MTNLELAKHYFEHAQFCRDHGYDHEAEIFLEDSWYYLFLSVML